MRREILDIPWICTSLIVAAVLVSTRGTNILLKVPPQISCNNITAMKGNTFVELICTIKVPGITCASDNIFWENGENGDRYDVNYNQNGLRVFCLNQVKGLVSTTLMINEVTEANFETVYFVVYVNKHSTSTRKLAILNQGYTSWTLVTRPKLFCGYMQLHCFLDDNIPLNRIRQWGRGPDDELLVYNGTSVNKAKYEEELDATRRISILTIKDLSHKDVNVQYICRMGFQRDKKWLNITTEDFQCTVMKLQFSIASFVVSVVVMVVFVTATFLGIAKLSMLPIC